IGARSLEECLLIQLTQFDDDVSLECRIVASYLDDLASNRIQKIAKAIDVSLDIAQKACDRIRKLEPKPGREFASLRDVRYVTPDVYVDKIDGKYVIRPAQTGICQ
ncbi:RNA polymerase sigma factor 54 like protein, partial [Aduncisulcus paluster]